MSYFSPFEKIQLLSYIFVCMYNFTEIEAQSRYCCIYLERNHHVEYLIPWFEEASIQNAQHQPVYFKNVSQMITHTRTFFFRKRSNEYADNFSINYQVTLKWLYTLVLSLIHLSVIVASRNLFCLLRTVYNPHI